MIELIKNLFKKNYESLDGKSFQEKYKSIKNSVLIDVRTPSEFSSESIRGARNINVMSPVFESTVQNLDKEKTYFLYCRSGARSGRACNAMSKMGFKVYNLSGGIFQWPN
jgi:rhodanese-related sulfurtransferase